MSENNDAMMSLVRGVVALSEATRGLAATGYPDDAQIAALKAKTSEIMATLKALDPAEPCAVQYEDVPEPQATSASSKPTVNVLSLDEVFD